MTGVITFFLSYLTIVFLLILFFCLSLLTLLVCFFILGYHFRGCRVSGSFYRGGYKRELWSEQYSCHVYSALKSYRTHPIAGIKDDIEDRADQRRLSNDFGTSPRVVS